VIHVPGKKFPDADLFGIPLRVTVSKKTLESNCVEVFERERGEKSEVEISSLSLFVERFFPS
jgi:prolyl-tRNA synthetase